MVRSVVTAPVIVAMAAFVLVGCTFPAPPETPAPTARVSACEDPVYLGLRSVEPDSLTERQWERLQQLEALCLEQLRASTAPASNDATSAHHGRSRGQAMWLVMPAMMVAGGLMWLMMGVW